MLQLPAQVKMPRTDEVHFIPVKICEELLKFGGPKLHNCSTFQSEVPKNAHVRLDVTEPRIRTSGTAFGASDALANVSMHQRDTERERERERERARTPSPHTPSKQASKQERARESGQGRVET